MLVVTTENVPGYEVRDVLGEVHGITARSRNAYNEGIKFLTGGSNPRMSTALSRWRDEAIAQMTKLAYARGANAIVSMRFDNRDISNNWTEICAYGTAVFVVPAMARRQQAIEQAAIEQAGIRQAGTAAGRPAARGSPPARGWAPAPTAIPVPTD
jgi:uncharacterized protein YbjQ (UPF0145 family)